MNGKKMSWMGVALLPFIDEKVFKALRLLYHSTLGLIVTKKKNVARPPLEAKQETV